MRLACEAYDFVDIPPTHEKSSMAHTKYYMGTKITPEKQEKDTDASVVRLRSSMYVIHAPAITNIVLHPRRCDNTCESTVHLPESPNRRRGIQKHSKVAQRSPSIERVHPPRKTSGSPCCQNESGHTRTSTIIAQYHPIPYCYRLAARIRQSCRKIRNSSCRYSSLNRIRASF